MLTMGMKMKSKIYFIEHSSDWNIYLNRSKFLMCRKNCKSCYFRTSTSTHQIMNDSPSESIIIFRSNNCWHRMVMVDSRWCVTAQKLNPFLIWNVEYFRSSRLNSTGAAIQHGLIFNNLLENDKNIHANSYVAPRIIFHLKGREKKHSLILHFFLCHSTTKTTTTTHQKIGYLYKRYLLFAKLYARFSLSYTQPYKKGFLACKHAWTSTNFQIQRTEKRRQSLA